MQYQLVLKEANIPAHIDIEHDMEKQKNGLFTFTIRINNGNIVDYSVVEYVSAKDRYLSLKQVIIEEHIISHHHGE